MVEKITQDELDNLEKIYFRLNFNGHYLGTVVLDVSTFSDLDKIKVLNKISELENENILEEI